MKFKAIVTGATGMVGEGVLHECLQHPDVEAVLVINRKPCGVVHPKLKEVIHSNFLDLSSVKEALRGYDACFFCLGVSSVGMKEPEYTRLTYDLTIHMANTLAELNPDTTFCYVSGRSTDGTEQGKSMWARVKGRTENALLRLFKNAYMFRPGFMRPTPGLKNTLRGYKLIGWLLQPLLTIFAPKSICDLQEVGLAMIHTVTRGYNKRVLEVPDIVALAHK